VPNFRNNLAVNLKMRRGSLTQDAFARKLGIDQASVNRIEQGEQNITIDTLQLLCERLKCRAADLLDAAER
jgi:transcriptional regulator with XRE-family HTH domain